MSESIISETSPEKSLRTQERLSAMIESLGEENNSQNKHDLIPEDQDDMQSLSSSSSSDQFEPLRPPQQPLDTQFIHTPPDQKLPSSSSNSMETDPNNNINNNNNNVVSNNFNNIPDKQVEFVPPPTHLLHSMGTTTSPSQTRDNSNRFSMMSDYSGVIHEGTEISYVVKNPEPESIQSHSSSSSEPIIHNDVVIKQIKNAKPVSRFNSLHSSADTPSKPPRANLKYHSDPLLLIQDQTIEKLNELSIDSSLPTIRNGSGHNDETDTFSIQSSVVPPLTTTTTSQDKIIEPTRSEINNDIIPTVPPRNKNRPRTIIFDEDESSSLSRQMQSSPKRSPKRHSQPQPHQSPEHNKEFNVHTISQLLSMTNGTLIGSEFQDLPIPVEEKRSLERLVDSLSRLTADMVLDPERYEEGLTRLKRAIRALEGFK